MNKQSSSSHSKVPLSSPPPPYVLVEEEQENVVRRQHSGPSPRRFWVTVLGLPLILFLAGLSYNIFPDEWLRRSSKAVIYPSRPCASTSAAAAVSLAKHSRRAPKAFVAQIAPPIPQTTPSVPNPFPQPFDTSIQQNFTSTSCQNFFLSMLSDQNFRSCRAFSLLLASSQALVQAQTNGTTLNNIMWGTCNTSIDEQTCVKNMNGFASNLQVSCSSELSNRNANVMSTLQLLLSYDMMRSAGCQADQTTNSYCYVEAALASSPVDLYFYQLPLGISLPSTVQPSCSPCIKTLMGIYANTLNSVIGSQLTLLSAAYRSAAAKTQATCGPNYATSVQGSPATKVLLSSSSVVFGIVLSLWLLI